MHHFDHRPLADNAPMKSISITTAITHLHSGDIIAYPTEAVYGLGCDPFNQTATTKLCQLKHRPRSKGLILIAADWSQVKTLTAPIPLERFDAITSTWPGPNTWVFPASNIAPAWITGDHNTIAIRITDHPTATALCRAFNGPLVSTSANLSDQAPATNIDVLHKTFPTTPIVEGALGTLTKPTPIREALTGKLLRE